MFTNPSRNSGFRFTGFGVVTAAILCFRLSMPSPSADSEDRKSDDLEIVSVGALYSGSWDKKYWSSSRGKDRFPYPVGYRAVRAHSGNTYYMEIEEGAKGPLFLIRYMAESWTGQTPDIAWGKFQKTGFSHLKIWHGKRFTCKMSGMEFFGFKNPLVQRLLRELVINSHGMEESSSRVSQIPVDDERPVMCENPNLSVAKKKRSRKPEIVFQNSVVEDGHKKPRFQDSVSGGKILNSAPVSNCSAKGEVEIVGLQGGPPEQLHSSHATNENSYLPSENPQVKLVVLIQETNSLPDSCKSKPLSKFSDELHELQEKENKPNNENFLYESEDTTGSNLCAPDTLDFLQDNSVSFAPKMDDYTSCEQKEELTLANMVASEGLLAEPNTEDLAESGLNLTSKISDSDSADQETAKSMISLLLPQAIPLLKKASRKKAKKNDMSGTLSSKLNRPNNCTTSQVDDASVDAVSLSIRTCSGDDENMQVIAPDSIQGFTSNVAPGSGSLKEAYPADLPKMPIAKEQELCAAKGNLLQKEHHSENNKPESTLCSAEGNVAVGTTPTEVGFIRKEEHKVYSRKRRNRNSSSESKNSCGISVDDDSISRVSPIKTPRNLELQSTLCTNSVSDGTNQLGDGSGYVTEQYQGPELMKVNNYKLTNVISNEACVVPQDMRPAQAFGNASVSPFSFRASKVEDFQAHIGEALGIQLSEPPSTKSQYKEKSTSVLGFPASSNLKLSRDVKINNEMENTFKLLGCYFNPMPVSSVSLQSVGNEIYICVLSFATEDRVRTLFMYKISAKASSRGVPSIIGHTPVILPIVDDKSGGNRTLKRSYFHFTPDGQHLIFTGNIKTPYCRNREIDCSCLTCTSACFEENAVRIVDVKTGHVSLVTKLEANDSVQCVVVCDPNYLIAVVTSGNLIVWNMSSHWRGPTEEFVIVANPCISSCIVELKKIPKCAHLVIGHNGVGEFTIWDISKRSLVSRCVTPRKMIFEFIPTSLFAWHPVYSHSTMEDHIDMILAATKLWFSKGINNKTLLPAEVKDGAIWLLVSTELDSDAKREGVESVGRCWRLALLVRNQVILGSQLDPRACVAGTVTGHGVTGTVDGLVYLWDLSTGSKMGSLHDFKGQGVSCISSDDSGNICIASEDGQLLVYCHPREETQNQGW